MPVSDCRFLLLLAAACTTAIGCRSTPSTADHALDWQFERVWSIGGAEGKEVGLSQVEPFQLAVRGDSLLYVLDRASYHLYLLRMDGSVIDTLGGQGAGPGEFTAPWAVAVDSTGGVSVVDMGARKLVRWSATGAVLPPVPIEATIEHPRLAFQRGRAIATLWSEDSTRELHLIAFDARGTQVLARMARAPLHIADIPSCGAKRISLTPLFMPAIHWDAAGDRLAVSTGAEYIVQIFDSGAPLRIVSRPIVPVRTTQALAEDEAREWRFNDCLVPPAEVVQATGYREEIPVIEALTLSHTGELWVQRRTITRDHSLVDVFDTSGNYLGTLPPEAIYPAVFIGADSMIAVEKDANDIARVSLYRIRRTISRSGS